MRLAFSFVAFTGRESDWTRHALMIALPIFEEVHAGCRDPRWPNAVMDLRGIKRADRPADNNPLTVPAFEHAFIWANGPSAMVICKLLWK